MSYYKTRVIIVVKQPPIYRTILQRISSKLKRGTAPFRGRIYKTPLKMGVNIGGDFSIYGYRCSTTTTTLVFFKGGSCVLGAGGTTGVSRFHRVLTILASSCLTVYLGGGCLVFIVCSPSRRHRASPCISGGLSFSSCAHHLGAIVSKIVADLDKEIVEETLMRFVK